MSTTIRFHLNISNEEFLDVYTGAVHAVLVEAEDGRRIQIPASNFRCFVTAEGLQGRFELELDQSNRLINLARIQGNVGVLVPGIHIADVAGEVLHDFCAAGFERRSDQTIFDTPGFINNADPTNSGVARK